MKNQIQFILLLLSLIFIKTAAAQPVFIKDIPEESYGFSQALGNLYFFDQDSLWISNGTSGGTVFLKDLGAKTVVYTNQNLEEISIYSTNNRFFFITFDGSTYSVWRSDGTSSGTTNVATYNSIKPFGIYNNEFYYGAISGSTSTFFKVGTDSPVPLKNLTFSQYPISLNPALDNDFAVFNGFLYFEASGTSGPELWRTNGSTAGTVLIKEFDSSDLDQFVAVGGNLYFRHGFSLYKSDGTSAGTIFFKGLPEAVGRVFPYIDRLMFTVTMGPTSPFFGSLLLFITDGTETGTKLLRDIGIR